ncbi:hypothetical protein NEMIN01_0362 [Nematocida minor]|uniref:uncharacterized protein n=1 Tax=Nematocida minor TaxID=1912983 RepID=UPI002220CFAF|nr:uncharacterized protein NEMIN01_0362 [Nematocida minor]KAI5189196.1 hypothetical protein NEMIN01_0362 [Nematocida minor]
MITKRALKQVVIVGVFALAHLQNVKCTVLSEEDAVNIKDYWSDRITYMEKEVQIRRDFLSKAECFRCNEIPSDALSKYLKEGNDSLSSIETKLLDFNESAKDIVEKTEKLVDLESLEEAGEQKMNVHEMHSFRTDREEEYAILQQSLPSALFKTDLLNSEIKRFDSSILGLIEEYSKMKNTPIKIHEMALFRLAKTGRPFAVDMVYSLFKVEPFKRGADVKKTVKYIKEKMSNYIPGMDLTRYMYAIKNDIKKDEVDLLALADKHFHTLFGRYGADAADIDVYLDLLKEKLSEEEIDQYVNIVPGQIMKIIMVERAMNGSIMDHRKNTLFSSLGKVIANIGKPKHSTTDIHREIRAARDRQDKILDALHILWSDCRLQTDAQEKTKHFCKQSCISLANLEALQKSFLSVKWMYTLDMLTPTAEETTSDQMLFKKEHFDMSYTHPMCYIYLRCESISYLARTDLKSNRNPFTSRDSNGIALRLYKISKKNRGLERAKNMKDCIRAWSLGRVEVIRREEDGQRYSDMANEFKKHLEKSPYGCRVEMSKEKAEAAANESNPLQKIRMEVVENGFVLVN